MCRKIMNNFGLLLIYLDIFYYHTSLNKKKHSPDIKTIEFHMGNVFHKLSKNTDNEKIEDFIKKKQCHLSLYFSITVSQVFP